MRAPKKRRRTRKCVFTYIFVKDLVREQSVDQDGEVKRRLTAPNARSEQTANRNDTWAALCADGRISESSTCTLVRRSNMRRFLNGNGLTNGLLYWPFVEKSIFFLQYHSSYKSNLINLIIYLKKHLLMINKLQTHTIIVYCIIYWSKWFI